jgi:hypothetical protein
MDQRISYVQLTHRWKSKPTDQDLFIPHDSARLKLQDGELLGKSTTFVRMCEAVKSNRGSLQANKAVEELVKFSRVEARSRGGGGDRWVESAEGGCCSGMYCILILC